MFEILVQSKPPVTVNDDHPFHTHIKSAFDAARRVVPTHFNTVKFLSQLPSTAEISGNWTHGQSVVDCPTVTVAELTAIVDLVNENTGDSYESLEKAKAEYKALQDATAHSLADNPVYIHFNPADDDKRGRKAKSDPVADALGISL